MPCTIATCCPSPVLSIREGGGKGCRSAAAAVSNLIRRSGATTTPTTERLECQQRWTGKALWWIWISCVASRPNLSRPLASIHGAAEMQWVRWLESLCVVLALNGSDDLVYLTRWQKEQQQSPTPNQPASAAAPSQSKARKLITSEAPPKRCPVFAVASRLQGQNVQMFVSDLLAKGYCSTDTYQALVLRDNNYFGPPSPA
ncbi:hypothetical protein B0T17DRAFT_505074 [Bombardia bombarda]|uniref:Uncharacterized protein n=1 Tax=Bombardia bombarda TaxID=252184 RepID=A0AA39X6V7_9PEZI|nr:hypothetical protein B0T17DRAFT_505074 [Bombardia bombarda]